MKKAAGIIGMVILFGVVCVAARALPDYKYQETKDLVGLVKNASVLIEAKGEAAFPEFKKEGSAWKRGKLYIFVMDTDGNFVVHPDPALEGKNQLELIDVNGKPIVKTILSVAADDADNNEGWVYYQWPEPGTIFSSWKSTFVKCVTAPSGKKYVVCCGLYNMKMEEDFLVRAVDAAAKLIEKEGAAAFPALRDKSGQFTFLGTYIFVDTPEGVEVVNGGFPDIEGKNILDYKDPNGKYLTRELKDVALKNGSGWVDYLWPKPGETAPSKKHTYAKKAVYGSETYIVGAGAYLDERDTEIEDIVGQFMVLDLKSGDKGSGIILRETKNDIYLASPDGSMEVSFPRSKIANIRKPTDKELAKLKATLGEQDNAKKAVSTGQ